MCTWVLGGSQRPTGLIVGFRFKSRPWQDRDVLSKYQRTVIPVLITGLFWGFFISLLSICLTHLILWIILLSLLNCNLYNVSSSLFKWTRSFVRCFPLTWLSVLVLRCWGRGDGVLTVRDGGSATVTLVSVGLPLHPISSPSSQPVLPSTWSTTTQPPPPRHRWAQEGRRTGRGQKRRGKRHQEAAASLSLSLFQLRLLLTQAGTRLPEMHSSGSLWGSECWQAVKTLTDCARLKIQCSFSFFLLYDLGLCVRRSLVSVNTFCLLWSPEELSRQQRSKATGRSFVAEQRVKVAGYVQEEILNYLCVAWWSCRSFLS